MRWRDWAWKRPWILLAVICACLAGGLNAAESRTDGGSVRPSEGKTTGRPADLDLSDVDVPKHLTGFERLTGSAERGEKLFKVGGLSCRDCHSAENTGESCPPSLWNVGIRLDRKKLITSILDPRRDLAPGCGEVEVVRTNGLTASGISVSRENGTVILVKADGTRQTFADEEVEEVIQTSPMPEGLADELKDGQEFADILAFLERLRESKQG
jgi:putative heme-binding domain-containing protein